MRYFLNPSARRCHGKMGSSLTQPKFYDEPIKIPDDIPPIRVSSNKQKPTALIDGPSTVHVGLKHPKLLKLTRRRTLIKVKWLQLLAPRK